MVRTDAPVADLVGLSLLYDRHVAHPVDRYGSPPPVGQLAAAM